MTVFVTDEEQQQEQELGILGVRCCKTESYDFIFDITVANLVHLVLLISRAAPLTVMLLFSAIVRM